MLPTAIRLSKASRRPLTPKRGNKDFYKGTRQAFLPGGHRTGAPGVHVIRGKSKYRLVDEKVRIFVAPPLSDIESSLLKPYVSTQVRLTKPESRAAFGKFPPQGLTAEHLLNVAREHTKAETATAKDSGEKISKFSWRGLGAGTPSTAEASVQGEGARV